MCLFSATDTGDADTSQSNNPNWDYPNGTV